MSIFRALLISLLIHAGIAFALVMVLTIAPSSADSTAIELEIGAVELSISERAFESETIATQLPSPAQEPTRTEVKELSSPEIIAFDDALPNSPIAPDRPTDDTLEPEEIEADKMVTPEIVAESIPIPEIAASQAKIDVQVALKSSIKPEYPESARKRGEEGDVGLELEIDEHGKVIAVTIATSSGYVELDDAALKAVRLAKFKPARSGNKAVSASARITLTFRLK